MVEIEAIVKDLKGKGLKDEEIIKALDQMVAENRITDDDLEKAKGILSHIKEKESAEKLFDMKF